MLLLFTWFTMMMKDAWWSPLLCSSCSEQVSQYLACWGKVVEFVTSNRIISVFKPISMVVAMSLMRAWYTVATMLPVLCWFCSEYALPCYQ